MKPRAYPILRGSPGRTVLFGLLLLPFGVLSSFCGLGLLVLIAALSNLVPSMVADARRLRGGEPTALHADPLDGTRFVFRTGLFVLLVLGALLTGLAVSLIAVTGPLESLSDDAHRFIGWAAALVGGSLSGAALAPFAFVPTAAATGTDDGPNPFLTSFSLSARVGFTRMATLGAKLGLSLAVCFVVISALAEHGVEGQLAWVFFLIPFLVSGWLLWVTAAIADLHVQAETDEPERSTPARGLGALVMVVAPVLVLLAGALVAAVFTPTPLTDAEGVPGWGRGMPPRGVLFGPELQLPGTDVYVRAVPGGVDVSAPDGGGAGLVRSDWDSTLVPTLVVVAEAPDGPFRLYVTDGMDWQVTRLDREGVRLDDGLAARTVARLGAFGLISLGLGGLLLMALLWLVGSRLGQARTLSAAQVDTLTDMRPGGPMQALEGRLRVPEEDAVMSMMRRGRLQVRGDAWVDALGGEIRLRMPPGVLRVWGAPTDGELDGAVVTLLSRFDAIRIGGFRSGPSPWPKDGRLVFGTIDDAGAALVTRTVRTAALVALPMIAACLSAAALMLSSVLF